MKISSKLGWLGAGGILVSACALMIAGVWQSSRFNARAQQEVDRLVGASLDNTAQGIVHLVKTQDDSTRQQVGIDLNVAHHVLEGVGRFRLEDGKRVTWKAVNQFTKAAHDVTLPRMALGKHWLGQNRDLTTPTPFVDAVKTICGATVTVFQRVNQQGDILRVATNVPTPEGKRAIGTYIPAVNPDGTPNKVVSTVMQKQTYRGNAFVVNAWYISIYEPIVDSRGEVMGVLYVGVKQENIPTLRETILNTKVGQNGTVFVLGGKDKQQGQYLIGQAADGQDGGTPGTAWNERDAQGHLVGQAIVGKALALGPDQFGEVRYQEASRTAGQPRNALIRLAYYAPWDWVIGVRAYEEDFQAAHLRLSAGQRQMVGTFLGLSLLLALGGAFAAWRLSRAIARPLNLIAEAANRLAIGDTRQALAYTSHDEIGQVAEAFRNTAAALHDVTGAAERIAQGDLNVVITPRSPEDALGHAFAAMAANLRDLTGAVGLQSSGVADTSAQLAGAVAQTGEAASRIAETIDEVAGLCRQSAQTSQEMAQGSEQQARAATDAAAAMEQLYGRISDVETGGQRQQTAVEIADAECGKASAAVDSVARSAAQVSQTAQVAAQTADRAGRPSSRRLSA